MDRCPKGVQTAQETEVNLTWKLEIDAACFVVGLLLAVSLRFCCTALDDTKRRRGSAATQPLLPGDGGSGSAPSMPLIGNQEPEPPPDEPTPRNGDAKDMEKSLGWLQRLRVAVSQAAKDENVTFSNYFRYLVVCCCTFMILFLTSLVVQIILDDSVDRVDENEQSESDDFLAKIFMHRPMQGGLKMKVTLVQVIVNGIQFLVATVILDKWCESPEVEEDVRRTMWVHGLPVKDQRLNPFVAAPFQLTSDDLQRVGTDLAAAFNEELQKKQGGITTHDEGVWAVDEWDAYLPRGTQCKSEPKYCVGNEIGAKGLYMANEQSPAIFVKKVAAASRIARVWVTPVVDQWRSIADKLQHTIDKQQAYDEWALRYYRNRPTDACWRRLYERWGKKYEKKVHRLKAELFRLRLKPSRMCGSAFVMFRNSNDLQLLMGEPPRWWDCGKWMCLWNTLKFGHVPFTSVTLEYEPAPHPGDIIWDNMHLPRWRSELLFWFFTFLLAVVMLVIVTPLNVPQVIQALEQLIFGGEPVHDTGTSSGSNTFANHFSSLLLLLINRTLLPFPIQWIAIAGRFRRRSDEEIRQMHLNFLLLIVNTWIAPLVGVVFLQQVPGALSTLSIPCIAFAALAPKRLFVGYLIDATFLTNLYGVLCGSIFGLLSWMTSKVMAIDVLTRKKPAPPVYSFGYYYAWTLSLVALSLFISATVPNALLVVAICFCIKTIVDWVNLRRNVYETLTTQEGVFITIVVFYMRLILCAWWVSIGVGLGAFCQYQGCSEEVERWLFPACVALIVFAGLVLFLSFFKMWYARSMRRFIPGRLQKVEATNDKENDISDADVSTSHQNDVSVSNQAYVSTCKDAELEWDARPALRSPDVEALLDEVRRNGERRRPQLAAAAEQCLMSGQKMDIEHIMRLNRGVSCRV